MREIKFRAWDAVMYFMVDVDYYKIDFKGQVFFDNDDKSLYNQTDKLILMQYTGLKDKDGVEIYEGDYLLDGHSGGRGEVKFYKGAFIVEFDNEMQDLYDWTYEYVIGNIYENLELLRED